MKASSAYDAAGTAPSMDRYGSQQNNAASAQVPQHQACCNKRAPASSSCRHTYQRHLLRACLPLWPMFLKVMLSTELSCRSSLARDSSITGFSWSERSLTFISSYTGRLRR